MPETEREGEGNVECASFVTFRIVTKTVTKTYKNDRKRIVIILSSLTLHVELVGSVCHSTKTIKNT